MKRIQTAFIRAGAVAGLALLLAACAAGVRHVPSPGPVMKGEPRTVRMASDVEIRLPTGYGRTLRQGSRWGLVGGIAQGDVYRAEDGILTVEGANVHEAYLVVAGDRLVGFYLPVEKAFVPLEYQPALPIN